ncbi:hypothetical protein Patl1_21129 [Pistacia atlantica]|uniref:Uncharacterized protein n=1 Tax=Pistacia atlantica TaxID=434234 RepID=A0ACC1BMM5_9ROSI|nr:hypothetical protein Patl1_21129 [Pistacia atlantica]
MGWKEKWVGRGTGCHRVVVGACNDKMEIWTIYIKIFSKTGFELENIRNEAVENLKILDKLLDGKKFFGGECAGFLDIVFGWIAYWTPFCEEITGLNLIDKTSMPNLEAWSKIFLEVSWVKEILPPSRQIAF